ncbi:MAG: DUF2147 domain-containing protein [Flammeovirgaceae bacterium]
MKKVISTLLLSFLVSLAFAQESPVGIWKTIDDETGEAKSHVEIYEQNGKLFGKIVKLLRKPEDTVCEKCPGDKKGKKLIGMVILENMVKNGNEWEDGTILKADNGKVYDCKLWVENGKLMVRGYIGFIYKTQVWERVK